jgi:hypothetical protein
MTMLNSFAAWTGFACTLVIFTALPLTLFAAGSGHLGWAIVGAAVMVASLGLGIGTVAAVVHYDHQHHKRTPRLL